MNSSEAVQVANEIMAMYSKHGGEEYAGEKVSQLEHMVQAAQLAEQQGFDEEVILAAFLHDIGHICEAAQGDNEMDGYGIKNHEEIAARYLTDKGFSKKIIRLVQSHVDAKRYLTYRYPEYYEQLSAASKKTLEYQGGKMGEEEAAAFEKDPLFTLIIQLRKWDEQAKIEGMPLPQLEYYHQLMLNHLQGAN
ncbi:phosphonate degradation HD-domain oxygenase [Terrimonas pollutisoli]|uniref:phosphonate degradation HD-domain oxygenase n=1 Tax=Terrimonas pollutisoli TaxID=3034147 RepID=UPI0023EBBA58|nr:phosphonate degradation HD-domain oxygenase [Terrimonas sp. H1YJ31]